MKSPSIGFIGGGRITRIMLHGFERAGTPIRDVVVSDVCKENLIALSGSFPGIRIAESDNTQPAGADIVFIAVHPPAMESALGSVAGHIKAGTFVVSLAPKFRIKRLSDLLGSHGKIVRMIPNAPSIVDAGFNPVAFPSDFSETEKIELKNLFARLGECPEVAEEKLEAYAMITAMGPTYLWFQWCQLHTLAMSFGLSDEEARAGIAAMLRGAERTMYESGESPEEVIDLIPSKPLKDDEEAIRDMYSTRLRALYSKLTN